MHHAPTAVELTRREATLREAICQAEANARRQLEDVCRRLDLPPMVTRVIVIAGLEVAREVASVSTYAHYHHRTGTHWPEEWRGLDDEERDAAWRLVLQLVDAAAAGPR